MKSGQRFLVRHSCFATFQAESMHAPSIMLPSVPGCSLLTLGKALKLYVRTLGQPDLYCTILSTFLLVQYITLEAAKSKAESMGGLTFHRSLSGNDSDVMGLSLPPSNHICLN